MSLLCRTCSYLKDRGGEWGAVARRRAGESLVCSSQGRHDQRWFSKLLELGVEGAYEGKVWRGRLTHGTADVEGSIRVVIILVACEVRQSRLEQWSFSSRCKTDFVLYLP